MKKGIVESRNEHGAATLRVNPPMFDRKLPWTKYLKQFEAVADGNELSPTKKTTALRGR